jgi:hypothetical protein
MKTMRELINVLTESRGLGARKTGEEFVSTTNPDEKIYVNSVVFYPVGESEYPSYEEMVKELEAEVRNIPNAHVDLVSEFKKSDRAFGVAIFDKEDGSRLAFVKPFKQVTLDPTQNNWSNQTGIPGYRYNSKAAAKTQAGATPQDILTEMNGLTASDVVSQIAAKFGDDHPLTNFAHTIATSNRAEVITIPPISDIGFKAFTDYFCELMHPIALQNGLYTGDADQAAQKFLGANGFAGTVINFGADKTEGLSDSILIAADGRTIKVSSKAGKGAEASAKNLIDVVNEVSQNDPELAHKHADVIEIVNTIVENGQARAPLMLGVRFDIITEADAEAITVLRKSAPVPLAAVSGMKFSKKLKDLMLSRNTDNPDSVNLFFHGVAAVAHKVAQYVNQHTNFSAAASEILNNGSLVQVYTKAAETKEGWVIKPFYAVWPGKTVDGVKFSASKTYYSTGIKGNFTFLINKKEGDAESGPNKKLQDVLATGGTTDEPSTQRINIRPTRAMGGGSTEKGNLGRGRR